MKSAVAAAQRGGKVVLVRAAGPPLMQPHQQLANNFSPRTDKYSSGCSLTNYLHAAASLYR